MLFQTELGGRDQAVRNGEQSGFAVAMPAPIDGNGFEAKVDGREMGTSGDTGLAQDRRGQQAAQLGRVLQHRQFAPGIEGNDGLQHRRQILELA